MKTIRFWVLLGLATSAAFGQTPVQGRDYTTPAWRGIAVDTTGKLILSATSTPCAGTNAAPCKVAGPDAPGAAPTQFPVLVGGSDGTNVRTVSTTATGQIIPSSATSAAADGVNNDPLAPVGAAGSTVFNRVFPLQFNGSTWDREFGCTQRANIGFALTSGTFEIIPLSGTTVIRLCYVEFGADASGAIRLVEGTGSNCGTGTANLTGQIQLAASWTWNFGPDAALRSTAGRAVCISVGSTSTFGVTAVYAQY